jgi:hypothetical protein
MLQNGVAMPPGTHRFGEWNVAFNSNPSRRANGRRPKTSAKNWTPSSTPRCAHSRECWRDDGRLRGRHALQSPVQDFEILGEVSEVEPMAIGTGIRDLARLRRLYGKGRWRKMKGVARIRLNDGRVRLAELHWYEAHGIGRKEFKRKRNLD